MRTLVRRDEGKVYFVGTTCNVAQALKECPAVNHFAIYKSFIEA
jgi:hypothetical protein